MKYVIADKHGLYYSEVSDSMVPFKDATIYIDKRNCPDRILDDTQLCLQIYTRGLNLAYSGLHEDGRVDYWITGIWNKP